MSRVLLNESKGIILTDRLFIAKSFLQRARGLMLKKELAQEEGLLIVPCNSIHMLFMRFPIDAVFLTKDLTVLKIINQVKPWLSVAYCRNAFQTIELPAGKAVSSNIEIGDQLKIL